MSRFLRPMVLAGAALAVFSPARVSEACWCSRVFTRSYYDPCVSCPTVVRSYSAPVVAACPTTSCSTTNVERCYYEPVTTYETRTLMSPQSSFIRRSYYDPVTCCNRSYLEPVTQYVERSYQVPITTHVKRCSTEPVKTCTTTYTTGNGSAYFIPETRVSHYWSPDGYRYYPVYTTAPAVNCPVSNGNGSSTRESGYGPAGDSKKSGDSTAEPPKAPDPVPMLQPKPAPEKKDEARVPGGHRGSLPPTRSVTSVGSPSAQRAVYATSDGLRRARQVR
jgi:hypothetical protein